MMRSRGVAASRLGGPDLDLITVGELDELTVDELLASEDLQMLKALEVLDALPESDTVIKADVEAATDDAAVVTEKD